jgi:hypothetical protein
MMVLVNILEGGVPKEVEVTLGLKGSSGTIEVKGGLTEGQSVVTVMPN